MAFVHSDLFWVLLHLSQGHCFLHISMTYPMRDVFWGPLHFGLPVLSHWLIFQAAYDALAVSAIYPVMYLAGSVTSSMTSMTIEHFAPGSHSFCKRSVQWHPLMLGWGRADEWQGLLRSSMFFMRKSEDTLVKARKLWIYSCYHISFSSPPLNESALLSVSLVWPPKLVSAEVFYSLYSHILEAFYSKRQTGFTDAQISKSRKL